MRLLDSLSNIYDGWASGSVPYPCTNEHIMEELAFSAALSQAGDQTVGLLSPEDAPFYAELSSGEPCDGIVLHVWSGLYRRYLQETAGGKDVGEYDFQRRRDALHRMQLAKHRTLDKAVAGL